MRLSALGTSANELLEAFATQLVAQDPTFDLPAEQYVGAGEIPWDGPGLYVYLGDGVTGQPGAPIGTNIPAAQGVTFAVSFYVMLIRSVASYGFWAGGNLDIPGPEILGAEGVQAVTDAGALLGAAAAIKAAKSVVTNSQGFVIGQVTPLGPSGGLAAVRLQLDLIIEQK